MCRCGKVRSCEKIIFGLLYCGMWDGYRGLRFGRTFLSDIMGIGLIIPMFQLEVINSGQG